LNKRFSHSILASCHESILPYKMSHLWKSFFLNPSPFLWKSFQCMPNYFDFSKCWKCKALFLPSGPYCTIQNKYQNYICLQNNWIRILIYYPIKILLYRLNCNFHLTLLIFYTAQRLFHNAETNHYHHFCLNNLHPAQNRLSIKI
jgi:hypothetical protein